MKTFFYLKMNCQMYHGKLFLEAIILINAYNSFIIKFKTLHDRSFPLVKKNRLYKVFLNTKTDTSENVYKSY